MQKVANVADNVHERSDNVADNVADNVHERSESMKKCNVQITLQKLTLQITLQKLYFSLSTLQITLQKVANVADNVAEKTPFFEFLNVI